MRTPRSRAAILATDVVGYLRLTWVDKEGALAAFKGLRVDIIDKMISERSGPREA